MSWPEWMPATISVLLLSLIAGLGTGLGGLIAILRRPGRRSYGLLMGITAGVMISLSFMELVNKAWMMAGFVTTTVGFAIGALFMLAIDMLLPHVRFGEAEAIAEDALPTSLPARIAGSLRRKRTRAGWFEQSRFPLNQGLFKSGMLIAIGITIHNMPEGIAVGAGYAHLPEYGLFIAMAIALHNIPEGIATALPLCKAGASRAVALRVAVLSGLTEPLGALLAITFLSTFHNLVPAALAFAGGVMTFITLDELIPTAREHGHQHWTAIGIILGAIFVFLLSGIFGI
jgi:ZIP family zinc transporter